MVVAQQSVASAMHVEHGRGWSFCLPISFRCSKRYPEHQCRPVSEQEIADDPEICALLAEKSSQNTQLCVYEVCPNGRRLLRNATKLSIQQPSDLRAAMRIVIIVRNYRCISDAFGGLFQSSSIEVVIIWRCNLDDKSVKALAHELSGGHKSIRELLLPQNCISSVGVRYLASAMVQREKLHTLSLADNACSDEGCHHLAQVLKHCPNLRVLNIECNNVGHAGACLLAKALEDSWRVGACRLEKLLMSRNAIGDFGAVAFASALHSNMSLRFLDISDNGISVRGVLHFPPTMSQSSVLRTLIIRSKEPRFLELKGRPDLIKLRDMCPPLIKELSPDKARAFMMALHPRLGRASIARELDADLARNILQRLCQTEVRRAVEY